MWGSLFSYTLHDLGGTTLLEPVTLTIAFTISTAFLVYLVELEKPAYYLKVLIWAASLSLVLCTSVGRDVFLFLTILTGALWVPLWHFTSLEIKHTRWTQLYEIATDSLSSIETSEEDEDALSIIMEILEHLKNQGIMQLDGALTDQVLFSKDIQSIVDSVCETLQEQSDSDEVLEQLKSKIDECRKKSEA